VTTTSIWCSLHEAAQATQISPTVLRQLKSSGALPAGSAWVYLTGSRRGRVGWSVSAIQQWQAERTVEIANEISLKAAEIETYTA
jgi:predicted DNA-binding transcriptional regulator AlpA